MCLGIARPAGSAGNAPGPKCCCGHDLNGFASLYTLTMCWGSQISNLNCSPHGINEQIHISTLFVTCGGERQKV